MEAGRAKAQALQASIARAFAHKFSQQAAARRKNELSERLHLPVQPLRDLGLGKPTVGVTLNAYA